MCVGTANHTCPTGEDASLSSLLSQLGQGLAEGELQAGLEQHKGTHGETSREVGYIQASGQ